MFSRKKPDTDSEKDKKGSKPAKKLTKAQKKQLEREQLQEKEEEESEERVQIAIRFLANPKVSQASDSAKKQFLKKKGLSNDEIKEAYKQHKENLENKTKEESEKSQQQSKQTTENNNNGANSTSEVEDKVETLEQRIEGAQKTGFLSLRKLNETVLNQDIFKLGDLKTLIINQNIIQSIPSEISSLQNLKIFHAISCKLTNSSIHENLWKLPELIEINISKNKFINIDFITDMPKLVRVDAADNEIMEIPDKINKCESLKILNVRNNNINDIPPEIATLDNLSRLLISGNNIDKKLEETLAKDGIAGLKVLLQGCF